MSSARRLAFADIGIISALSPTPMAVAAIKRAVTERTAFDDTDAFAQQDQVVAPVLASEDAQEGARAFAEKRRPHWQGR